MKYTFFEDTDFKVEVDKIASKFFFVAIKNIYLFLVNKWYFDIKKNISADNKTKFIYEKLLKGKKDLFLIKEKVRIWNNQITIGDYNFALSKDKDNHSFFKQIEWIISWIDKKWIIDKESEKNKEHKSRTFSFNSIIERNKEKVTTDKDIEKIIKSIIDTLSNIKIKRLKDNIEMIAKQNDVENTKVENIFFYDLETLGVNIATGVFIMLPINNIKSKWRIPLIFLYKNNPLIKDFNEIYKEIVLDFKSKIEKENNTFIVSFMEHDKFVQNYKINNNILSWYNNIKFDNPILFKNIFDNKDKEKIDMINNKSLDFYNFLTQSHINDWWKLDLLAKNNLPTSKLIQSEELLSLLKPEILNNRDNYNKIYKLILYNALDSILVIMLLEKFLLVDNDFITWITKRIDKKELIKYLINNMNS